MGILNNIKTFINVGFLAGTDMTVEKAFGDYESAAQAQADINRLAAIMDSNIVGKRFSKRKTKEQLFLEDILGEPEPTEDKKQSIVDWYNSLDEEGKATLKELLK